MSSTIVIVPTCNERDNIGDAVARILSATPWVHVLIVDDGSPDGTGGIADDLSDLHRGVHVLHRAQKEGLGAAYRAGFGGALARDYSVIVEMDADGSHLPEQLVRLLDAVERAGVVVGSRWVSGGSVVGWPLRRRMLSRAGSAYARYVLDIRQRDVTGGFRAFRAEGLRIIEPERMVSSGYSFQVEVLWAAMREGLTIEEVPITFVERTRGRSKMSLRIVWEALARVTIWGLTPESARDSVASDRRSRIESL